MEDTQIIALFENRNEAGIEELSNKYGKYCSAIAWNILSNREDVEECVNDTWYSVWRYIPPQKPRILSAFCGKIVKGLAIDRMRRKYADKRIDTHMVDIGEETEVLNGMSANYVEDSILEAEMLQEINQFLAKLPKADRDMFIRRYWYLDSIQDIATRHGKSIGAVKTNLHRTRRKLQKQLKERGLYER